MSFIRSSIFRVTMLAACVAGALALGPKVLAQSVDSSLFSGMKWRLISPARGGRSLAVTGSTQRPNEYFFGATGGGVWKTTDGGVKWAPVSDGYFGTSSVGALAVAPSNPDIVYAGTGGRDIRGNISHGDGLYRSKDAGVTWTRAGLDQTQTISKIVIDPVDPNTVYVAALGHIYGKDPNRGVYKSRDAGQSWTLVLPGAMQAGAVDLVMDPSNPKVLMATIWDAWRTPYAMNSGGANSAMFRSEDAGETWSDVSRNPGLPSGILGKIGVSISAVDSKLVYAMVEAAEGGLYRSTDAAKTWTKMNADRNWRQRAWYYTHVYADPKDKESVYVLNVGMGRSVDGGKTFRSLSAGHSDFHDLWISPTDSKRMIVANDGGACVSVDSGVSWTDQDFPTGQFYHVSTDNNFPYRILGAQQDNSTIRILSRTDQGETEAESWTGTAGGESGYVAAKPNNPDIVFGGSYGGDLSMLNHRTGQSRSVDPWPDNPMGHGAEDLDYRFQWTFPILFSPHNPEVLYTCSQFVMKSTNLGESWQKISPDLTRNDKSTLGSSGGPLTKDNTSVEYYGTVFTFAESPSKAGVMWAGSDDGLVHVSQNGGKSWSNVTPPSMPKWGLVSMIDASPHAPGTAFVAVDNHENDDYTPHAYRTTDFGRSWTEITSGVPSSTFFRAVREDKRVAGLLYGGTESGMFVSFDSGANWQPLQMNLPNSPVHDIALKDDDVVIATHGRGFWVLDDISPLQSLARDSRFGNKLFAPRDAYPIRWQSPIVGQTVPSGILLNYFLDRDVKDVKFEFSDAAGKVVYVAAGNGGRGFHRQSAFLSVPTWTRVAGMIIWGGGGGAIVLPPGKYGVKMITDAGTIETSVQWKRDPRSPATDADMLEKYKFQIELVNKINEANSAVLAIRKLRTQPGLSADTLAALTKIEETIYQTKSTSCQDPLNYPIRLNNKLAGVLSVVSSGSYRPTKQSYEVYRKLAKELDAELAALKKLQAAIR